VQLDDWCWSGDPCGWGGGHDYGIVDGLIARHEGAKLDSDVFLAEQGVLPLTHTVKAHVIVTRVEPEIFVPPLPGQPVYRAAGLDRDPSTFLDDHAEEVPSGPGP